MVKPKGKLTRLSSLSSGTFGKTSSSHLPHHYSDFTVIAPGLLKRKF